MIELLRWGTILQTKTSSIKTTEKYAQFSLRRLEQDFTMLVKTEAIVKRVNNNRVNIRHTSINPHLLN